MKRKKKMSNNRSEDLGSSGEKGEEEEKKMIIIRKEKEKEGILLMSQIRSDLSLDVVSSTSGLTGSHISCSMFSEWPFSSIGSLYKKPNSPRDFGFCSKRTSNQSFSWKIHQSENPSTWRAPFLHTRQEGRPPEARSSVQPFNFLSISLSKSPFQSPFQNSQKICDLFLIVPHTTHWLSARSKVFSITAPTKSHDLWMKRKWKKIKDL